MNSKKPGRVVDILRRPISSKLSPSLSSSTVNKSNKSLWTLAIVLVVAIGTSLLPYLIPQIHDQVYRLVYNRAWTPDLDVSKGPLVQIIDDDEIVISWESLLSEQMNVYWPHGTRDLRGMAVYLDGDKPSLKGYFYREYFRTSNLPNSGGFTLSLETSSGNKRSYPLKLPFKRKHLRIAVLGDNQMGKSTFKKLLGCIQKDQSDVFLHLGDMVQVSWKNFNWQDEFFNPLWETKIIPSIPFLITQGNHDYVYGHAAEYFPDTHELPSHPSGNYYSTTLGGVRFLIMDSNCEDDQQIQWLEKELQRDESKQANFRAVAVHVPPFIEYWDPIEWKRGERTWPTYVQERAVPLFEKYKVDLVMSGHQHNYQRGTRNGITYVISGGGGGLLDTRKVEDHGFYSATVLNHHYVLLDIKEDQIDAIVKLSSGVVADSFNIVKRHLTN